MRVLLVEDDPMIGRSLRKGLRHEGHSVDRVRDGRTAQSVILFYQTLGQRIARFRKAR